ncbi:MAG: hypothetical protein IK050_00585 [Lachnospiraceae bacterium]|nr:hypothetical protein [Lachnospiraceae bacterium]MBR4794918.1 hypothetical protein [Lachnospiraceae bacterium]
MKLKSYLRGIGAGMIVTALIMGVAAPKGNAKAQEPVSNETLLESVKDVSEAESSVVSVSDTGKEVASAETQTSAPDEASISSETSAEEDKTEFVDISASVEEPEPEPEPEPEGPPAINPMPDDETGYVNSGETVLIKVIKGDSSVSVSRRIFEAGLVESAVEFDNYLCENHYDKSISVGEYEIEQGADFETIAKTITRRR